MIAEPMNVNFLAVAVAAAIGLFGLGGLWYSKALFGEVWNREAGQGPKSDRHPALVFGVSYALSFIAAWFLAAVLPADASVAQSTMLGILIGACWVATSFGINYGFGSRSLKLWLIDAGYHVLQFTLYGIILGAWR